MKLEGAPIRGNTNKDVFDIRGGANKKLTYTGKRQFREFETSVWLRRLWEYLSPLLSNFYSVSSSTALGIPFFSCISFPFRFWALPPGGSSLHFLRTLSYFVSGSTTLGCISAPPPNFFLFGFKHRRQGSTNLFSSCIQIRVWFRTQPPSGIPLASIPPIWFQALRRRLEGKQRRIKVAVGP